MKSLNITTPTLGLLSVVFMFTASAGCSSESGSQVATEDTAVVFSTEEESIDEAAEEDVAAPMDDEAVEEEVDMQVSRVQPEPVKKPENKDPVLTALSTSYKDWNADGNNVLDKEEFYGGLYNVWDADQNNEIGEDEFMKSANEFFTDYNVKEYGDYAEWDADGNGNLSAAEFRSGMKATVDQDPTAQDLLVIWDTDNDDAIERIELDNITVRLDKDSN